MLTRKTPMKRTQMPRTASTKKAAPAEPKRRVRKCAVKTCRTPFEPRSMAHKVCGPACAAQLIEQEKAATLHRERQAGLAAIKTRAAWLKEAQAAFNAFIRARDHDQPCISCGRFHEGSYDAGHYRSVGAQPALRFNESNVHKQCVPCNQHKGGNIVEYRLRLIDKIGAIAVELLEVEHEPAKYTIEDAKRIKEMYKAKLKALKEK